MQYTKYLINNKIKLYEQMLADINEEIEFTTESSFLDNRSYLHRLKMIKKERELALSNFQSILDALEFETKLERSWNEYEQRKSS